MREACWLVNLRRHRAAQIRRLGTGVSLRPPRRSPVRRLDCSSAVQLSWPSRGRGYAGLEVLEAGPRDLSTQGRQTHELGQARRHARRRSRHPGARRPKKPTWAWASGAGGERACSSARGAGGRRSHGACICCSSLGPHRTLTAPLPPSSLTYPHSSTHTPWCLTRRSSPSCRLPAASVRVAAADGGGDRRDTQQRCKEQRRREREREKQTQHAGRQTRWLAGMYRDLRTGSAAACLPPCSTAHSLMLGTCCRRQGHAAAQGRQAGQGPRRRRRRQEAQRRAQEARRAAAERHRGGQHVQGGRQRAALPGAQG